jgi:hypothetical protein
MVRDVFGFLWNQANNNYSHLAGNPIYQFYKGLVFYNRCLVLLDPYSTYPTFPSNIKLTFELKLALLTNSSNFIL